MADTPLNINTSSGGSALVPTNSPMSATSTAASPLPMVTLPSVPNPTPPPPKTLAVVTPKAAQKDLSSKQQTTDAVAGAVTQQTQNQLTNTFGQPVSQGGGSPVPQQPQGQQQPQNGQQTQQSQQGTGTAQAPQGTTTTPNATTVTLPNGVQANYAAQTQTLTTLDGKQLSWNGSTWVDPTTGQPPQAVGSTTGQVTTNGATGLPSTGDPTSDYVLASLNGIQAQADAAYAQHTQALNQILNGTVPLTADQQAQVSGLQSNLNQLRQQQQQANQNYLNSVKLLGVRAGQAQYQPGAFASDLNEAITKNTQKMVDFDNQAAGSVAQLKQGFQDNDYKIINQSYQDLQDALKGKTDTLTAMQNAVKDQVDIQTAKVQQQTDELTLQNNVVSSIAQSTLQQALKADGTLDLDAIQKAADENGIDANVLYGAVQKAQQAETTFQQSESKFASDQLQAQATLAQTQANTAKTYQDIKTAQQAASGGAVDLTSLPSDSQDKLKANGFTNYNSGTQGLAISLVTGQLAPSELSKRTTGSSSYSDILNAASAYSQATTGKPFNIAQADRDYKYATNVQTQNTLNYLGSLVGQTDGNGNLTGGNLDNLVDQSNGITRTSFPAINDTEAWAKLETGNPAIASYYATVTEVSDQVAKILQGGGSGSGTSDAKLAQASALFQKGFSKDQINAVANTLKDLLQNRAQGIVGNNPYLSDYADQFGIQQDNGAPGQTQLNGKGSQSDKDFVESTLDRLGKGYDEVTAAVPKGQIGVINNQTGAVGSIPPDEYDASLYTSI